MTIRPLLCAAFLAALSCSADPYDVPDGCPKEIPAPPHAQAPRGIQHIVFFLMARTFYSCIVFYVCPTSQVDPWDAHVWVLQRSSPNYQDGAWESLSTKVCSLTTTNAVAMFSDRIDRDNGTGAMVSRYRVVDMGSWTP